jgi:hypothetical protein
MMFIVIKLILTHQFFGKDFKIYALVFREHFLENYLAGIFSVRKFYEFICNIEKSFHIIMMGKLTIFSGDHSKNSKKQYFLIRCHLWAINYSLTYFFIPSKIQSRFEYLVIGLKLLDCINYSF